MIDTDHPDWIPTLNLGSCQACGPSFTVNIRTEAKGKPGLEYWSRTRACRWCMRLRMEIGEVGFWWLVDYNKKTASNS